MEIVISLLECCSQQHLGVPEKPQGLWTIRCTKKHDLQGGQNAIKKYQLSSD